VSSGGATAPKAIGQVASTTAALNAAGLANTITAGTFTINAKSISIDPAIDSLTGVVNKINSAGAGVTASIVADTYGRNNVLQLKSATTGAPIQLGSATDSSTFLASTGLVANNTDTVQSGLLGALRPDGPLSASAPGLVASFTASGSFSINGKTISYASSESLNTVLGRINSSAAGVTAAYDARTDRVTLTNQTTGSATIAVKDLTGNFLQGVGLVDATNTAVNQSVGQSAAFQLNGGPTRYSNSNTVTAALPGVTLNLLAGQPTGSAPVTITIGADTAAASKTVQAFVTAYNDLVDAVAAATKFDPLARKAAALTGDSAILGLAATTRRLATAPRPGTGMYRTLADVGVSTGPVGISVGSTSHLVVDSAKLTNALQTNANAVQDVVSGVARSLDTYVSGVLGAQGLFATEQSAAQAETRAIARRLAAFEDAIRLRTDGLTTRFASMEKRLAQLQATHAYIRAAA
jgi:flagellar hook-associated protein 2